MHPRTPGSCPSFLHFSRGLLFTTWHCAGTVNIPIPGAFKCGGGLHTFPITLEYVNPVIHVIHVHHAPKHPGWGIRIRFSSHPLSLLLFASPLFASLRISLCFSSLLFASFRTLVTTRLPFGECRMAPAGSMPTRTAVSLTTSRSGLACR